MEIKKIREALDHWNKRINEALSKDGVFEELENMVYLDADDVMQHGLS